MRNTLIIFIAAGLSAPGYSSVAKLSGHIVDATTGAPIRGVAAFTCGRASSGTVADDHGVFVLTVAAGSLCHLRISANGYQALTAAVKAPSIGLFFRLRPISDVWEAGEYRSAFLPGSMAVVSFFGPDVDLSRDAFVLPSAPSHAALPPVPRAFTAVPPPAGGCGPSSPLNTQLAEESLFNTRYAELNHALESEPAKTISILGALRPRLTNAQFQNVTLEVLTAIENEGQRIILRYLDGDAQPQPRSDFIRGRELFATALRLLPDSPDVQARYAFFEGRELLFNRDYAEAEDKLEKAAPLARGGAYIYNALGVAYLEQGKLDNAAKALRDAIRRAPCWAYPRHNLAVMMIAAGDYAAAIKTYRDAIAVQPKYAYLSYNLGLTYQRLGQAAEANKAYRQSLAISPSSSETLNALGTLYVQQGKLAEARHLYEMALASSSRYVYARHNLALILPPGEAQLLFRENLKYNPEFLPSRLSLAGSLADSGQSEPALKQYEYVLKLKPEYLAARVAVANLLAKMGRVKDALSVLADASHFGNDTAGLWELTGDLEISQKHNSAARRAYEAALDRSFDPAAKLRIRRKLGAFK